jgi:aryl-phospho-beta-D-glucosidase BglC (GH1 family)
MNMENFINGYPGVEQGIRAAMADVLGADRSQAFFDRWLDHFLADADLAFIRSCGANCVRLPMNYRHFERDDAPFRYLEGGFERARKVIRSCERHGLYAVLDLHAVQGWQNPDWHCDNASRQALFWQHPHFQDRFVAMWEELARQFKGEPAIAAYNVMNEPVTGARRPRIGHAYATDWDALNRRYRRVVGAIRKIDPDTAIVLEGDCFSVFFEGLEPPFAENLIYSSHNYTPAGFGPGAYPGMFQGEYWDREKQKKALLVHQGTQFAQRHGVPLWVGEFGSVSNGPAEERPSRLAALDDQLSVFEEFGVHWSLWTYKDVGVMGWLEIDPNSAYMKRTSPIRQAKLQLGTDFWMHWLPQTSTRRLVQQLGDTIAEALGRENIDEAGNQLFLNQATLDVYLGSLTQPLYAKLFKGMNDAEEDEILRSFAFDRCRVREDLMAVVRKHTASPSRSALLR